MPLSFPSSPTVGQVSVQNSRSYTYRGNNVWELTPGSGGEDSLLRSIFVPPAPTGLTAVAGNAEAALSWTTPTVLSVTPISDYVVQFSSNGGSTWSTFSDGTSTATSATVTGLTNGTAYTFRVAAVNNVGQGAYSSSAGPVTPINGDPLFGSVALLLHADGNATDSSASPKTVSLTNDWGGSPPTATGAPRFGSASFSLASDGQVIRTTDSAFNRAGSGTFTCEMFFKPSSLSNGQLFKVESFFGSAWDSRSFFIGTNMDGALRWNQFQGGSNQSQSGFFSGSYSVGQWNHLAACREDGTQLRVYLNGTLVGTIDAVLGTNSGSGQADLVLGQEFVGQIDEVRWTNAVRYTGSSLVVPTAPFLNA